jgi:hypothetical protein
MIVTVRDVINALADGSLDGVREWNGAWFAAMLISPVGVRWNEAAGYFEYRDGGIWLSEHMQARCIGLPVLAGADPGPMDSNDFGKRCIGTVVAAYVDSNSLMCVARICNDSILRIIQSGAYDTRITAHFNSDAPAIDIALCRMIIEPAPRYLSHISIVPRDSVEFEYGFVIVHKSEQGNLINARP